MTVPSYYNTAFTWAQGVGSTDVQDAIDAVVTAITTTLPVGSRWTSMGGGQYKSPPQDPTGANRFMYVTLARTNQFRMGFHVQNQAGGTVRNGEIDFTTSMTWRVATGPYHISVEFEYGGGPTYENAIAAMVDPTPFSYQSVPYYIAVYTNRNNVGSGDGYTYCSAFWLDPAGQQNRISIGGGGSNSNLKTTGGNYVIFPAEISTSISGVWYGAGKLYQFAVVSESIAQETVITVPLDSGTNGQFQVLGRGPNSGLGANHAGYIAVRYG